MQKDNQLICCACSQEIAITETAVSCPECGAVHHETCWYKNGGCSTPGCSAQPKAVQARFREEQTQQPPAKKEKVCANCGVSLEEGQSFCPKCGKPTAPPKRFCSRCGTQLQPDQVFCPNCGASAAPAAPAAPQQTVAKKKKFPVLPVVLGGVAVIVAVVLAIVFLGGPKVESITLSESNLDILVGDICYLEAVITPEEAAEVEVTWTSSNPAVATVTRAGKVEAVGAGNCVITATAGDQSDTVTVSVVSLSAEEKMLVGSWIMIGYIEGDEDLERVSSTEYFVANEDFTGYLTLGDVTVNFTWSFEEIMGDYYNFKGRTEDSETFDFCIGYIDEKEHVMVLVGDYAIFYHR